MSNTSPAPFIELATQGEVLLEEIDDFVDDWHESGKAVPLATFLGMTDEEYALWAVEPDMLPFIVRARHNNEPLPEVVNDNFNELRIAARASDIGKAARLSRWLAQHGYID